jgi:hypothetical protein
MVKGSFTKHLSILHRRGAENAETSQRGKRGKGLLISSLRSLGVLRASAVNGNAIFLALQSFEIWPFRLAVADTESKVKTSFPYP